MHQMKGEKCKAKTDPKALDKSTQLPAKDSASGKAAITLLMDELAGLDPWFCTERKTPRAAR